MSETLTERYRKTAGSHGLIYTHLPSYARYIRENHLIPYIQEQIRMSQEMHLPMLKYFAHLSDEELLTMSIAPHTNFLVSAEENKLSEQLSKALAHWINDQMGIVKKDELTAEDIALANIIRKKALLKFLPSYTTDVQDALNIVKEIDDYSVASNMAATNLYLRLLNARIREQSRFSEILSNTTPGFNYVYNLLEHKTIYCNDNYLQFTGNTLDELTAMGPAVFDHILHPDDKETVKRLHYDFSQAEDKEVRSWDCRLKNSNGQYFWVRNYVSVFKRDTEGKVIEIVGISLDIDEQKQIAEQLKKKEAQLLQAQEHARVGSFELDIATETIEATPQILEIYGIEKADFKTIVENIHPDDLARISEYRTKAIAENGIYENEYRYLLNGQEKMIWARGKVIEKNGRKIMSGSIMDVTSLYKAMEQLRESERRYKQAQDLALIGNWTWDLVTNNIEWTDSLYDIYGLERGTKIVFDEVMAFNDPGYATGIKELLFTSIKTQQTTETYFPITLRNGTRKILHARTEPIADRNGKTVKIIGVVQDVTERQLLIEKLQQSEMLYKQAQAISHTGNWSWNTETQKLEWSEELYRIYEIDPEPIETNTFLDKYQHPDDYDLIRNTIQESLASQQPFEINYRIVMADGRIKTLNAKGTVRQNANGSQTIFGTVQDITDQKNVERQLKDYQEFIEKITDVTPSIIATYNIHTGQYSFVNEAMEKLLGYSPTKVIEEGLPFLTSLVHPDDLASLMNQNNAALAEANRIDADNDTEPIVEFKYRMRNKNGEYRWLHTYGTIFERNEKGLVESILNISVDITDQEKAERTLFQKNLQLQQSNKSLEEYAYIASHDLKEPLRKIATFSDRLLTSQHKNLSDDGKVYLKKLVDSSKRMQTMINDLLSISTISGNKAYEKCDLNIALSEAQQLLDHKIDEANAIIESDKLPVITAVPAQFRQLLQNLISNSIKFARKHVSPVITINHSFVNYRSVEQYNLVPATNYLKLVIKDNGIGFDDEYAEKIFAIFQRLHGKLEYEGTGIGLSVCKKIVENHRGVILANGLVDQGATFTIILPIN